MVTGERRGGLFPREPKRLNELPLEALNLELVGTGLRSGTMAATGTRGNRPTQGSQPSIPP